MALARELEVPLLPPPRTLPVMAQRMRGVVACRASTANFLSPRLSRHANSAAVRGPQVLPCGARCCCTPSPWRFPLNTAGPAAAAPRGGRTPAVATLRIGRGRGGTATSASAAGAVGRRGDAHGLAAVGEAVGGHGLAERLPAPLPGLGGAARRGAHVELTLRPCAC